jgi:hypothetical protein
MITGISNRDLVFPVDVVSEVSSFGLTEEATNLYSFNRLNHLFGDKTCLETELLRQLNIDLTAFV